MDQYRPLIMRSNRFLGSALVERNLLEMTDLEAANARLLEVIQGGDLRKANLLNILFYDLNLVEEGALIEALLEECPVGLIDLNNYDVTRMTSHIPEVDLCHATQTVPFDQVESFTFLATTYYLSQPARQHWEDQVEGEIIWYVTTQASLSSALEPLDNLAEEEAAETAEG